MDYCGIKYTEEPHAPGFYRKSITAVGSKTVPTLVSGETILGDTTPIVAWCSDNAADPSLRILPENEEQRKEVLELEELFDTKLGPPVRQLVYFHILDNKPVIMKLFTHNVPWLESWMSWFIYSTAATRMKAYMKIDAEHAALASTSIDEVFAHVGDKLKDGRRYLVGEKFSIADLCFASLASPLLAPEEHVQYQEADAMQPPAYKEMCAKYRSTPAGEFALRLYREERHTSLKSSL